MHKLMNSLSIKAKILANSGILIGLMLCISGYALNAMLEIGNELNAVATVDIPMTRSLTNIAEHSLEQGIHLERAIRFGESIQRSASAASHLDQEIVKFNKLGEQVSKEIKEAVNLATEVLLHAHSEAEKKEISHVKTALITIDTEHTDIAKEAKHVFELLKLGRLGELDALVEKLEKEEDQMISELEELVDEISDFTEAAGIRAEQHEKSALFTLGILSLAAFCLGSYVGWTVYRNIISRLSNTVKGIVHMADGDFTVGIDVQGSDEIGSMQKALEEMRGKIREMISQISSLTSHLSSAAEEISAVMRETSSNIQKQQSETEQIASAMDQMSVAIRDVSTNVSNTSSAANEANAETGNGTGVVQAAVTGIQQLADQIERTGSVITQVETDSENINTVLDVIKSIAEQTNLLALNAAIEAARAGEQGRGFAVVADEVRTLAGRTQESTAEINEIIENLQAGSRNAVQAMTESREQAKSVVEQASLAGTSLDTIAHSVSRIDEMSTQIATAAEEQNAVAANMNSNIVRINDMATHNATSAKETYQAGQDLAGMASELQALVDRFKVNEKQA